MATVPSQQSESMWKKASASGVNNCVEVAFLDNGMVAVRDSKDRAGTVLRYTTHEWAAFLASVKQGEFDGFTDLRPPFGNDAHKTADGQRQDLMQTMPGWGVDE